MDNDIIGLKEKNVLIIEDEKQTRENLIYTLEIFYQRVYSASNIEQAYEIFSSNCIDLILSDIKLGDYSGLDLVAKIREENDDTPIILLTAHSDSATILKAVNIGIDGYLVKPVNLEELLKFSIKALNKGKKLLYYFTENLYYDYKLKALLKDGQIIELGTKEHKLLKLFLNNIDKTLSREEIEQNVWPMDNITDSALKNLINRFRKKIGFELIESIKGSGWRLNNTNKV